VQYDLTPFQDYEMLDEPVDLLEFRFHIQDAIGMLRDIMSRLDEKMIFEMRKRNLKSFEYGPEEMRKLVKYGKVSTRRINANKMLHYLKSGTDEEKEMAFRALSGGQSAWKGAAVQEMADTIGDEGLYTMFYKDQIELKVIPQDKIKEKK